MPTPRVIYWFRTDLRLHDSPALKAALDLKPECLYPLWTFDPHYVYRARVGPNRWQFLLDCQNDLSSSITKLNKKSKLFLIREAPQTLFPKLFKAWRITHLVFEKDTDAYARERDREVMKLAREAGVEVVVRVGRTLYDPDRLVEENGGHPTMTISQVQAAGKKIGDVPRPIPAPKSLPDPGDTSLPFDHQPPSATPDLNHDVWQSPNTTYAHLAGPKGDFAVPTLAELGIPHASTPHRGGETRALAALAALEKQPKYLATFSKPATAPTAFEPQSTTLLSPHLHFGSLSIRTLYWAAQDAAAAHPRGASQPPTSLPGQLLFRDMYFGAQAPLGHAFAQTRGNAQVRFVPWHLPSEHDENGVALDSYSVDSEEADVWFQRWRAGRTGFPFVDALMRQLRAEGWIHHLGRHMVACFLTRGGCYVHWERGAEVFAEWLIDHETACNAGNWQWLSCTAFFSQYFRCYSPVAFGAKWDKEGAFVRKYVPELKNLGQKWIYEPWKAPIVEQKKAGLTVKGDGGAKEGKLNEEVPDEDGLKVYPKPLFDFAERRDICIQAMKAAYDAGLRGNDSKVLDGTWTELFDEGAEGATKGSKGSTDQRETSKGGENSNKSSNGAKNDGGKKHKRESSQSKLDGHLKKVAKK